MKIARQRNGAEKERKMDDWDEGKEQEVAKTLAARPSGAVWEGILAERRALREKRRQQRLSEKMAKKQERIMNHPRTGAARAWFWIARAHVAATVIGFVLTFGGGVLGLQTLCAMLGESDDAVMIPVENDIMTRENLSTQLNSMVSMLDQRNKSFKGKTHWSTVEQSRVDDMSPGFARNLAYCVSQGFCQRFPTPFSKMSLWRRMPAAALAGHPLSIEPPPAAQDAGAVDGYVVWGTTGLVFSIVGSVIFGVLALFAVSKFVPEEWEAWTTHDARGRWAEAFCRWSESGLPEHERKAMLREAKKGRLVACAQGAEKPLAKRSAPRL
jgi:hypothetical protein